MTEVDDAGRIALRNAQALVGRTIAEKFSLDRLLGMGGMGAVYAATNTWTGRRVAVKMLLQSLSSADAVARLQQEARAATSVRHPHILDVLDMCRDEQGNFLIVTELLAGESLESLITKRTRLDPYRAVQLLVPVAAALAAAHSKGVVHRDIKPDNIFLHSEGGQIIPKVIDFGISKVVDSDARARKPAPSSERSTTCPPSKLAANASTRRRTSGRSAWCSTARSRGCFPSTRRR
jgi:serine/threonine protein kinase